MAWISVYQEVDGPKLRKLARLLNASKAEALGILNFLWFWGMNNSDETGLILEAGREDIESALSGTTKICAKLVVDSLFEAGWLDTEGSNIFIHDWDTWQEQWYKLQEVRRSNAERKRRSRSAEKERRAQDAQDALGGQQSLALLDVPTSATDSVKETAAGAKEPKSSKKKYAEFVTMTEEEFDKLVDRYGKPFVEACIEELDNYKGAKGKTYKNDYRAILSWVVDSVNEKRPNLLRNSRESGKPFSQDTLKNPFEDWSDK